MRIDHLTWFTDQLSSAEQEHLPNHVDLRDRQGPRVSRHGLRRLFFHVAATEQQVFSMVQSDDLRLAGGDADVGGSRLRLWRRDATADIEFNHTEGLLVSLNRLADGHQEPLGSVRAHDDPLRRLDLLAAGREGLGIQPKVEDHFLGSGC